MSKRLLGFLILLTLTLLLGACDRVNTITENPNVQQIRDAAFYIALQSTVARVQIPVIIVGLTTLVVGWKLGRFGLGINGFVIGGLILYTFLNTSGLIPSELFRFGVAIAGGVVIGLLAYFLYNFMALIIGGAIGMMLMNGAWLQIAANVPPALLVFITTFVSALVMFVVFRLFLVAFSAVIGAAILMLAVPFDTLWVIPVAIVGTVIQTLIALWIKDDIFQNLRGDFGAALSEAFGEVLGPFGVLREHQRAGKDKEKPAREKPAKPAPEPRPAVRQQPQPQQDYKPAQPSPRPSSYQDNRPAQQPPRPTPQQDYRPSQPQQPYQPPQQSYRPAQPSQPASTVPPQHNPAPQATPKAQPTPQVPISFKPEDYQLTLPNGQGVPLVGTQITVGRNPDNSIVINDPQVSGTHLICSILPDGVIVWDNNSTNGTYLNGILLTGSHRLTTSDVLQVGPVTLRLTRRDRLS